MGSETASYSLESRRRLIGREQEIGSVERWLAAPEETPEAATRLLAVSGIGGIGKTTLLADIAERSRHAGARVLWLDGQGELATPGAMLSSLEFSLAYEYGKERLSDQPLMPYIIGALASERTVLLVDNGEQLDRLEGWLLSQFLPRLPASGLLLIIASRNGLSAKWQASPYWAGRMDAWPLSLFTREQAMEYMANSGLPMELKLEVVRQSDGHPLLLTLTADLLRSPDSVGFRPAVDIPSMMSAEWLREAASPELHRALILLSLLPVADQATLNHLLEPPLNVADYYALGRLSCVNSTPQGLILHHLVARLLREDYMRRDPGQYEQVRLSVFMLLSARYEAEGRRSQMRIAAHVLELYREYLPSAHAYADFSVAIHTGEDIAFRGEDLPQLQRMLADSLAVDNWHSELVSVEDCGLLLQEIATHSPEGICVVRSDSGVPIGFCAGVGLHVDAVPLLDRYAPMLLALLGEEGEMLRQAREKHVQQVQYVLPVKHVLPVQQELPVQQSEQGYPEAADTVCVLLAAVDIREPLYRPQELGAVLMQHWLIHMASGWRGIMMSADPQLNGLFAAMGFREMGSIRSVPGGSASLLKRWEVDFRHTSFREWMQVVIRQTEPQGEWQATCEAPQDVAANKGASREGKDSEAAECRACGVVFHPRDATAILQCWPDIAALERLPVLQHGRLQGEVVQQFLLAVLHQEPPPYPLTQLGQCILRETYVRKELNKNQLAEAFHMSRTTFYRQSRAAVERLSQVLSRELLRT